ncbi:MAG: hypothetical protein ACOC3A_07255 [Thermodesulfobacteriota bacterium]
MSKLLGQSDSLQRHIAQVLHTEIRHNRFFSAAVRDEIAPSAVLMVLGERGGTGGERGEGPCLILNKRSRIVRQPGDLCCPGGGLSPGIDPYLARLLTLPGVSMMGWSYWSEWRDLHPVQARRMPLFLATGLREGFEEMRLNPLGVRFLGPLPPARLRLFQRVIYPMVVWVRRQKRFFPNWEVEKVVRIPLSYLLNPDHYARYRVRFSRSIQAQLDRTVEDFPCFLFERNGEREMLWGVTYRIVTSFLETVFGFNPPEAASLPVVSGTLRGAYLSGREKGSRRQ